MVSEKLSFQKVMAGYNASISERSEWEAEWRQISEYLVPGRGIYQTYSKPRKRKLTSPKVINPIAEDSLHVLTSGMHGGLTSPSRPWFKLEWADESIKNFEPLKAWLQDCEQRLHTALQASNFYSIINSFYIEYAAFGTGAVYVGEDTEGSSPPFRFELLTAGEYAFSMNYAGAPGVFYRTIFLTPRQLVRRFPETACKATKEKVEKNDPSADSTYITVVEFITEEKFQDKPFTRVFYEVTSEGTRGQSGADQQQEPLEISGYYEFPYPIARWGTIGSDTYGIGPGSRAVPDIKRLQEMEKAVLMATHKAINPPLNVPGRMRGKTNTLPGGENFYANAQETISEIYQVRFDYQGIGMVTERVEQRIQRNFFNDIFLTAARDPNASPLKATQVNVQEQEKMLRLGPVIERLQHEFLKPLIERCFNILLRRGLFAPLSPELEEQAGAYDISLVSPLATAQRAVALQGITSFMAFLGQAAQFDQSILDNLDVDKAAREMADINGVHLGILRPQEEVDQRRDQRAKAQAAEAQKQQAMMAAQAKTQMDESAANTMKTQAEAGLTQIEGYQAAQDMGMI